MVTTRPFVEAKQHTLGKSVACSGVGVHTGQTVILRLRPAEPYTGIHFVRKDMPPDQATIVARWTNVVETRERVVLANAHGVHVSAPGQLLAALRGCGIDNAIVELDGPEVPVLDGSAEPFVALIQQAGIVTQDAKRRVLVVQRPIIAVRGDSFATLLPSPLPRITEECTKRSVSSHRKITVVLEESTFRTKVAPARDHRAVSHLHNTRPPAASGPHGHDGGPATMPNPRFADESLRNKVLETVGDLALAGAPIIAHYYGIDTDHMLNHALLDELFVDPDACTYMDAGDLPGAVSHNRRHTDKPDIPHAYEAAKPMTDIPDPDKRKP